VLASAGFGKERIKGIIPTADGFIRGHLAIGLNAVLQAEQLPACVADLHAGLTDVNAQSLTHLGIFRA
jgi:hypothetical protein